MARVCNPSPRRAEVRRPNGWGHLGLHIDTTPSKNKKENHVTSLKSKNVTWILESISSASFHRIFPPPRRAQLLHWSLTTRITSKYQGQAFIRFSSLRNLKTLCLTSWHSLEHEVRGFEPLFSRMDCLDTSTSRVDTNSNCKRQIFFSVSENHGPCHLRPCAAYYRA